MTEREFVEKMLELSKVSKVLVITDNPSLYLGKLASCINGYPLEYDFSDEGYVCVFCKGFDDVIPDLLSLNLYFTDDYDQRKEAIEEAKPDYVFDDRDFSILKLKAEKTTPRVSAGKQ